MTKNHAPWQYHLWRYALEICPVAATLTIVATGLDRWPMLTSRPQQLANNTAQASLQHRLPDQVWQ
jgi:hypothetical protein